MEVSFMSASLSLFFLLTVSVFTYILSKKINFPYTVLLLIIGLILVPLSEIPELSFINHFKLTPDILFYVFLPILLFESSYNLNYRQLVKSWKSITLLAVVGLLISTFIVASLMYFILPFIGFEIPFLVCLLFWWLISATDPVAVLSIFKTIGAPRRLTLIFEWESLFNDGTALALFLIILGIILEWWMVSWNTYFSWIGVFLSMALGGIVFWTITWVVFSKVIWYIKNNEMVEITLTMILAHLTFLLAEAISHYVVIFWHSLHISWVIATTIAWIIIWNYGRYKISPKVEAHMNQFWEFFAFVSNSLVFILLWLILSHLEINFYALLIPSIIVVFIVMFSRIFAVFLPITLLNLSKKEEFIPYSWQFLLSWWSLRWAISLMMALMIPGPWDENFDKILAFQESVWWNFDFSMKDFIIGLTISCIMFTLFIKATTIPFFMRKFQITKLHELEEFEYYEWRILSYLKMLEKFHNICEKSYVNSQEVAELRIKYENKLKESVENLKKLLETLWKENGQELIRRALWLHALGIEKQYLKELFKYNEITERNFTFILSKINRQIERLESWKPQLKNIADDKITKDFFQNVLSCFRKDTTFVDKYMRNRTKAIITRKVIKELKQLSNINFGFSKEWFEEIIGLYQNFNAVANDKKDLVMEEHAEIIHQLEWALADKSLLKLEGNVIQDLYKKEIITPKLYVKFMDEIESEMYSDLKKVYDC